MAYTTCWGDWLLLKLESDDNDHPERSGIHPYIPKNGLAELELQNPFASVSLTRNLRVCHGWENNAGDPPDEEEGKEK